MRLAGVIALLLSSTSALRTRLQIPLGQASSGALPKSDAPAYRSELVALHKSLIEVSSVTYSENAVGRFVVDYLAERGFTAELDLVPPPPSNSSSSSSSSGEDGGDGKPRFNVVAWPGPSRHPGTPRVLVTSHIDTVPPYIPYSRSGGELSGDTIIAGRGSVDAKASVAAQITAVRELLRAGAVDGGDVMLLFVVGEERTGDGMRHFSDASSAARPAGPFAAAVFGEPTEGRLACGHKGIFGCDVVARGRAGHSGYPWLGKSATEVLMRGLIAVLDADLGGSGGRFGATTVNVGVLEGGVAPNVIPARAAARIAGRVAIGPESDGGRIVTDRVKAVLAGVDAEAFDVSCNNGYGVVECACDVPGFETITVNYGTDLPNLKGNHKRYLYGPGSILVAHGADEAIKLRDLEAGVEGFKKLILHAVRDEAGEEL
ncbi:hypothetical protein F4802DRAFT_58013 [Xylaria palmicola]|nr:hypothetical protein F4802DRAFT_58013 [Xylaria palmicola]